MANRNNQKPQPELQMLKQKRCSSESVAKERWRVRLSIVLMLFCGVAVMAQQRQLKLSRIQIEGLQRLSADEVVATTGLKVNESYDVDALDAAAKRLVDSGLFKKVGYSTRTVSGLTTITFQVEELKGGSSPVTFDNFVWFSEQELTEAIRRDVPSFNGSASDTGNMTDRITESLQRLLKERSLPGTVEYMPSLNERTRTQEHLFSVTGVRIPVCSLHFPGAMTVPENALAKTSKEMVGANYSRQGASAFASARLFPLYREAGHLRATFGQPAAKLSGGENCKSGVAVTISVNEGAVYLWDKAEWSGNQAMSVAALDTALGMKHGEVASGSKFDKGIQNVRRAYGRKGHLMALSRYRVELDDVARTATFKIELREGPQFRMGTLIVKGFTEGEERYLREAWRLNSGDIFDQGVLEEFLKVSFPIAMNSVSQRYRAQGKELPQKVDTATRPNPKTLTVDVVLEIVN